MRSVLLVDTDAKLQGLLGATLAHHRITLTPRDDGAQGLEAARTGQYDLMLLDAMLPGMDGFEVLWRLRAFSDLSVILLSAGGETADRVRGLQMGADDFLSKPFEVEELVARIHAVLRRSGPRHPGKPPDSAKQKPRRGFSIDFATRTVSYKEETLRLTEVELSLLDTFLRSPGVVLTREELAVRVFQRPYHPLDRSLDVYVSRLRRKLQSATALGDLIKTIRSSGYLFAGFDSNLPQFDA